MVVVPTEQLIIPYPIENVISGASSGTDYATIRCCLTIGHWSSLWMTKAFNQCPPEYPQDVLIPHAGRISELLQLFRQDT